MAGTDPQAEPDAGRSRAALTPELTLASELAREPSPRSTRAAAGRDRWAQLRTLVRTREVFLVLAAVAVGIGSGGLVTLASDLAQLAHVVFFGIPLDQRLSASAAISPAAALLTPVAGGVVLGGIDAWRRRSKAPPAVDPVEANALRGGRMSLRDSLMVGVQVLISNGCGASVGLESGYTQLGAGLASRVGIGLRLRRGDLRILVGAGAAAAISGAFGTPVTGAFYAFELIVGAYSVASVAPVMAASIAGVLTAQALGGAPYSIHVTSLFAVRPSHFPMIVILGLIAAGLGIGVMRVLVLVERGFEASRLPSWARPAAGGVLVGGLAMLSPQVLAAGRGAMQLDLPISMSAGRLISIICLKLLAAMISLGSGFRGGLFFASLFVGALVGKLFGEGVTLFLPGLELDPTICVLVGMGALAVAIVGGPLTMTFLILESTGDFAVTGAVLAACVTASLTVRETFGYSFSTWRLHLRGETIRSAHDVGWVRQMTVGRLMRRDPPSIAGATTLADFRRRYPLGSTHAVVVLDEAGRYLGLLPTPEAFAAERDAEASRTRVADIIRLKGLALTPEINVRDAMAAFGNYETETLAVVDSLESMTVIGLLTEAYTTRRYAEELDKVNRGVTGE